MQMHYTLNAAAALGTQTYDCFLSENPENMVEKKLYAT